MKSFISILNLLFYFLILIICGCENSINDIELTPREDEEAELIALCLSGKLVASNALYNQVLSDLATIRSTFGDEFEPIDSIRFVPPWKPSSIIIAFNDNTFEEVVNNEYHAWDKFNSKYKLIEIKLLEFIETAVLYFEGRLHPRRLKEIYQNLPGVIYIELNGLIGDSPNIYPKLEVNEITYLFRDAWGDCPSGCIYSEYWYFVFEDERPIFIGHWIPHENPEEPDWWNDAKKNFEVYYEF